MAAPMQFHHISEDLRAVLGQARHEAEQRHNVYLDSEHLLLGLLRHPSGTAHELFRVQGADTAALYEQVAGSVGIERASPVALKAFARGAQAVLDRARDEAARLGHPVVDSGHLLLSLLAEPDGAVHDALASTGLTADAVRAYLREHLPAHLVSATAPRSASSAPSGPQPSPRGAPLPEQYVLVPTRGDRARPTLAGGVPGWVWVLVGVGLLLAYMIFVLPGNALFTFIVVLGGWIFSVTLHEFAHALVAYLGGDYTVKDKGYLSFNPLKYAHPMLSIGMPLIFLALGGIGLPGGAVYIERHRLRNKWWGAAVSAAGPAANLLLALLLALPFITGLVDVPLIELKIFLGRQASDTGIWEDATVWSAIAFLAMLQITAVFFNLLPIPPLDGFGIIEPLLDSNTQWRLRQLSGWTFFMLFVALWFLPPVADAFWSMIFDATRTLQIPTELIREGFRNFMFWTRPPS